ncbi:ImuA family protein [Sphingomonas sp. GlSt437]|uniref:ImuA family protein n=1 Tax=Sphingomonas sp. GlSt437 TaxID=3389970 RepID=UPI003A891336
MPDSLPLHAALQRRIDRLSPARAVASAGLAPLGHEEIDTALGGGLARAKLCEIVTGKADDAASAAGFAAMCARCIGGPIAWLFVERSGHGLDPHGVRDIGLDPRQLLLVSAPDPPALLLAASEALRCTALNTVVIELWREPQRIDLTASRRLVLGAESSGVTVLLVRIAVEPLPNAAHLRWSVSAAPSTPLPANAPGPPTLDLNLLRQRGGPSGLSWRVEWDRDQACFRAPLSGDVAAVPGGRSLVGEALGRRAAG